jgi:FkbM family methyltransferase
MKESFFSNLVIKIEAKLKFPNLKPGEIGIQVGFDLSSRNLTSDVFKMNRNATNYGQVIAIDPDPYNHEILARLVTEKGLNIHLIQLATYSEKTNTKLVLGTRAAYNKIEPIQSDKILTDKDKLIEIEMDTLDSIIEKLNIDYSKIRHICITNNGAEYATMKGMDEIFEKCKNLNLTIATGRPGKMGLIEDKKDYEVISEFLSNKGFETKLVRLNKSFWRGFVLGLIVKRKWVFGKKRYGFMMAARGDRKLKFYQSLY